MPNKHMQPTAEAAKVRGRFRPLAFRSVTADAQDTRRPGRKIRLASRITNGCYFDGR